MKCPKCGAENPDYAYYCGSCASELKVGSRSGATDGPSKREPRVKIESILNRNLVRVGENAARRPRGLLGKLNDPFRRIGTIVFKSDLETASLSIDGERHASVNSATPTKPIVLLEGPHDSFLTMLGDGRKIGNVPESIRVHMEINLFHDDEMQQRILRDGVDKLLKRLFEENQTA